MNKCDSCIHRRGPDVEPCLQCRESAPSGANAALAVLLALLLIMAIVAAIETARFARADEGLFARLLSERAAREGKASPPRQAAAPAADLAVAGSR